MAPRTAQAAMRHSSIDLTMNVYTDPKLLDVAGAVEALPALPLSAGPQTSANVLSATGTDDLTPSPLVPLLVPATAQSSPLQSIPDMLAMESDRSWRVQYRDARFFWPQSKENIRCSSLLHGLGWFSV